VKVVDEYQVAREFEEAQEQAIMQCRL